MWTAPPGTALLMSLVLRDPPPLLPLAAAVAVAEAAATSARIKWPNDVLVDGRKVAGILAEGRPQEGWAVLGIGVNVAVDVEDLPPELHETAGDAGSRAGRRRAVPGVLLGALERALALPRRASCSTPGGRATRCWAARSPGPAGRASPRGIDGEGRLVVELAGGGRTALNAGEVHLTGGTYV